MNANAIALDALKKIVKNAEQSKFEDWLEAESPSGDVEQVQSQWENSGEYREFCDKWADAFAAIAALEAEPRGWRPISEAPKTSKTILVYCAERENIYTVTWVRDEEFPWSGKWKHLMGEYLNEVPTHYLPTDALPTPPKD